MKKPSFSFLEFFQDGEKAAFGKAQKATDPKDTHTVGLAMSMPLASSFVLRAEALQSSRDAGEDPGSALRLKVAGKLSKLDVEANLQTVGQKFRSAGGPALRPGDQARILIKRKAEGWQVSAKAAFTEAARPGAATTSSYGLAAERQLPGDWRSKLELERVEQPNQERTKTALALQRRFDKVHLGLKHRETETQIQSSGAARSSQFTSVDLRYQPEGGFSLGGGTSLEQRLHNNQEMLVHKLFLTPAWTGSEKQLKVKLRVGLDVEEHALDRERRRVVGQTSLVWKVRDHGQYADLSFDLSVRSVEDWARDQLDRRAGLKLTYRLGRAR